MTKEELMIVVNTQTEYVSKFEKKLNVAKEIIKKISLIKLYDENGKYFNLIEEIPSVKEFL